MANRRENDLLAKRKTLQKELLLLSEGMIAGFYTIFRKCGKAGCKCQHTEYKHGPAGIIHYREKGEIRMIYIPKKYIDHASSATIKYKRAKAVVKELSEINRILFGVSMENE